ncbi:hypothetical protein [uncultured Clostridium sp.]|jgi:hypothetical protein|uniref:hypothetical protein n=1 Tax=uncultured Clostridium sp. TaxID=59620 RepID=UPI00272C7883|nr:hypothetical protein [uncultured Clostridium sp.]
MNNILDVIEKRFNTLDWIIKIKKVENMLKIETQEGIEYICKIEHKDNTNIIIVKDLELNFCYESKISDSVINDDFHRDFIIAEIESNIFKNEMCLKAFKKGVTNFQERNQTFNINEILDTDLYKQFEKDKETTALIEYLWDRGYEFSSKYPYPEEVDKQYDYVAEKTNNISSIAELKEFIIKNPDIRTYLDEKKIPDNLTSLENFREIDYSYKNIVAKTYISIGRLNEKVLVFDTEGINEFINCHIDDYKNRYRSKLIETMFKNFEISEKMNKKMKLIQLLEPGKEIDFDICDSTYDYEVAFVMDNREPENNYESYLRHLAENLNIKENNIKSANIVVDISDYIEKNIEAYEKVFDDNDIERNVERVINMITGNANETIYKEILEELGENTIEEEREENEQD